VLKKDNTVSVATTDENYELVLRAASSVSPVNELNEDNRAALCKTAKLVHVQRNDPVQPEAANRWLMYLVEGSLQLFNGKEEVGTITARTPDALKPLFLDKTAYTMAKTSAVAKVVKFGLEQINILLNEQQKNAIHVIDVQTSEHDNLLLDDIIEVMATNKLKLATYTEAAKKILRNVDSVSAVPELAEVMLTDPGLTAHILKITNRADAGGSDAAHSVRGAISRLGVEDTKLTMVELLKSNTIVPANEAIALRYKRFHQRTTLSAAIAQVLSGSIPELKGEQAALVAMMSDIGELLVLTHANKFADKFQDVATLTATIENLRTVLNGWVLASWDFPESYIESGYKARDWYRNHSGEITYTDLVTASLLIIQAEMPESEQSSIPSVDNLLLARRLQQAGIDLKNPGEIMRAATTKIVNTQQMLKAG
jgi:HD-like signal output (HDOD) protein